MTAELAENKCTTDTAVRIGQPVILDGPASREHMEDICQVILWNDDHNEAGFVVRCLVGVFGHAQSLATKIMFEAHNTGKAIAEVEGEESAKLHCQQMQSSGLTCSVEKV